MSDNRLLQNVAEKLGEKSPDHIRILMGFDGFVDEVVHVVGKRYNNEEYERLNYMEEYGRKICEAAGLSFNIEMVPVQRKLGGNGPIMANSLASHGCHITYIGALGKEYVHPVFQELTQKVKAISISNPGYTDAIEFLDGKIISSKLEPLKDVNWKNLKEKVGVDTLVKCMDESDMIGFENWTLVVGTSDIWKHILDEVVPKMTKQDRKPLFVDLADPEKRDKKDILEALKYLEQFEGKFETILGLNEKEAYEIAQLFGKEKAQFSDVLETAEFLREQIKISMIVVHPVKQACVVGREGKFLVDGPYCSTPKLTTGAGDNFNAGFVLGKMLGLTCEEALVTGVANSGFYVRNARSASCEELRQFIIDWSHGTI
ncbi:PfkB family carbohydrate kinase [Mediterraneibacter massiliensis]|uniref:PfkB family carbohydrate kinase n=1 Tax=Mediterraneibacter massiliensis TaxID=1720300 RepID=UPI0024AD5A15|nr:PfkB family carbohydrate kinase [Mediterraneibacter massiliensis]